MVFFMEQLDTTILNTAVPAPANALGVSVLSNESCGGELQIGLGGLDPDQRMDDSLAPIFISWWLAGFCRAPAAP